MHVSSVIFDFLLSFPAAPSVMNELLQSFPPLPACELLDPHDDVTLPRIIQVLEQRQRIRHRMTEEYHKAGETERPSSTLTS